MDPDSTYYSGKAPVTLTLDDGITNWTVNNAEGSGGTMSVRDATVHSVNAVYAQLDLDVGPEEVRDTAYDMGITTHLDGFPAEGIGGLRIGVTPLEMANAYATLANGGIRNTATAISKVEFPNGDTDVPEEEERTRAFSDGVAYEVTDVLKGVITSGTGTAASIGCAGQAGKTGTTDDYTDAWFAGYTPRFSTAVWVGYADARTSMGPVRSGEPMPPRSGTTTCWPRRAATAPTSRRPRTRSSSRPGAAPIPSAQPSATLLRPHPRGPAALRRHGRDGPGSTNGQYPSDLYAPGAGAGPAPPRAGAATAAAEAAAGGGGTGGEGPP